ncbi:MAG: DUF4388 domain-containing protein [Deltaproteobacteria bacterium]|nr:DUF4388 domain-containing protein [Deltaproteobacteria bacterium]
MAHFADGYTLEDILLITSLQQKTGELTLETERGKGTLRFLNGNIVDSDAPSSTAIGDLLVLKGMVTLQDVEHSLHKQRTNPESGKIGKIFVENGKVDNYCIQTMVKEQIFSAIQDFSTWKNVCFTFQEKEVVASDDIHVSLTDIIDRMAVD